MALDEAVYSEDGGEGRRLVALARSMLPPHNSARKLIEWHYGHQHAGQAAGCADEICAKLRSDRHTPHRQETPP